MPKAPLSFLPVLCLSFALALGSQSAHAQTLQPDDSTQSTVVSDFSTLPQALDIAKDLEAKHGIPVAETLGILKQAEYQPKVVQYMRPAKTPYVKNWDTYRSRFVEPFRIRTGFEFWTSHAKALRAASKEYGVPQSVIVAIIGVETIYGRHTGTYRVLDALSTLGFAYPSGQRDRSAFFRSELEKFLLLCHQTHLDALKVKGSYAGAIGLGQFMPSSWLAYAKDGDNDGIIDLSGSESDAIFSVANFLKVHGWQKGATTIVPVVVTPKADLKTLLQPDIVPTFTSAQMRKLGLKLMGHVDPKEQLALIKLVRGEEEPSYVVGGQNFYVVTRYNRSAFYATAVLELAQALNLHRKLEFERQRK